MVYRLPEQVSESFRSFSKWSLLCKVAMDPTVQVTCRWKYTWIAQYTDKLSRTSPRYSWVRIYLGDSELLFSSLTWCAGLREDNANTVQLFLKYKKYVKSESKSKTLPVVLLIQRSENSHWTIMKRQLLCDYFIYNFILNIYFQNLKQGSTKVTKLVQNEREFDSGDFSHTFTHWK